MPASAVVAINADNSTIEVTPRPAARYARAVAQPRPARTKNCQGCSPGSLGRGSPFLARAAGALVEVAELIVDPIIEIRIGRRRGLRRRVGMPRPLHRGESDGDG